MKINRLLLSAVTTFAALGNVNAADPAMLISEPEALEYVRVCDAYGTGYFYLPGTETCLKVSGYVWSQVSAEAYTGPGSSPDYQTYGSFPGSDQVWMGTSVRLQMDTRSESELGTLHSRIRLGTYSVGIDPKADAEVNLNQAFITLGGFRAGYLESAWVDSKDSGAAAWGSHSWGGMSYGYFFRNQIGYSFGSAEGFAASLTLEYDGFAGDNHIPDAVAVLSYNQDWGAVWAKVGFDGNYDFDGDDGWGATAGLQWNVPGGTGSSFRLIGYYSDADVAYGVGAPYLALSGGNGAADWSVLASYYHQFTPTFGASVAGQYFNDFYEALSTRRTGTSGYEAEVALVLTPVENFEIRTEIYYDKVEDLDGTLSGFLRVTRSF